MASNISGTVTKTHGVIDELPNGSQVLLCDVSWNDGEPRTELRVVRSNGYFGPGLSVSKKGLKKLKEYLESYDFDEEIVAPAEGVDFSKIFESGASVSKARDSGYVTKGGRITLFRKR